MKLERETLAAVLGKLAPALAVKDLVQIWTCFCFEENAVHTYDDTASLRYPAKFGFTGGIRGELLLGFLNASRAKEIELVPGDGTMLFKAGRSKLDAPLLPASDFMFTPPPMKKATEIDVDAKFIDGLTKVCISMGRDASQVWRYGITVVPSGAAYTMFATDDKTICKVTIGKPGEPEKAILLPPRFVDLFVALSKTDSPKKMSMTPDWISVKFQSGLVLFSKAITGAAPKKYSGLLDGLDEQTKNRAELPKGFDRCLSRSALVIKHAKNPHTKLISTGDKLRFETQSDAGDVRDMLPFVHDKIEVMVAPELLERGLPYAGKIAIVDSCVRMSGLGFNLYVCTHAQSGTEEREKIMERVTSKMVGTNASERRRAYFLDGEEVNFDGTPIVYAEVPEETAEE